MAADSTGTTARRDPPPVDRPTLITFTPFRLDLPGGRLLQHTTAIPLRPKTWAVLLHLAQRPGVLVTKEALLDAVWPETAVTPDTLNKSIGELRVALGDDSKAPRFIETVHRRGFRFVAQVSGAGCQVSGVGGQESGEELKGRSTGSSLTPDTRHPTPAVFVGREHELRTLATCFAKAQTGERQIVFVTGPAGIGKTALVDAFLTGPVVQESVGKVLIGHAGCFEQHGPREAYLPVLEALDRLARRTDAQRLLELLRRIAPMWLAQMPWLLPNEEMQALRQSLQAIRAERMLREFALLIETLTTDATLVLVVEDLHWSDPSTVDLLSELGRRRDPARLLLIGTYRPADIIVHEHVLAKTVRTLQAHRQCLEVPLADFTEAAVCDYLAARFPGGDFPPQLARLIHAHTSGDPLYVVAVVDHMLARGWILDTAPGWALSAPAESIDLGVPDDVRRMIETQLRGLSPNERSLLEFASVAGDAVSAPLAAAALGWDVGEAERHCETLARTHQFLRVAGRVEWPDGSTARRYAFLHELHRQVAYEEIPEERCARLHHSVGAALETAHGAQALEIAPQLAVHFERGRDRPRALRYLLAAGTRARQRFANREAIDYFQAALALVALVPDTAQRPQAELEVRLALGPALSDIYGFGAQRVRENYERAAVLCTADANAAQRFDVLYALWYLHGTRAERDATIAVVTELDTLARRMRIAERRELADSVMVRTALYDGRFIDASRLMERRLARRWRGNSSTAPVASGPDPVIVAASHAAIALWFLGHPKRAQNKARAAVARARQSGHAFTLSAVLTQTAIVELLSRHSSEGSVLAGEALALSSEHGFAFWNTMASTVRGWASVQQGQATEGIDAIARALSTMQATGALFFSGYAYAFLADGHLRIGALAEALEAVDAGLVVTQTTLDRAYEPELWRLKGEILLASAGVPHRPQTRKRGPQSSGGAAAGGNACLLRALDLARASHAKSLELRTATSLARAWQTNGRAADARSLLSAVCRSFGSSSDTADLVEARALLSQLTAS